MSVVIYFFEKFQLLIIHNLRNFIDIWVKKCLQSIPLETGKEKEGSVSGTHTGFSCSCSDVFSAWDITNYLKLMDGWDENRQVFVWRR